MIWDFENEFNVFIKALSKENSLTEFLKVMESSSSSPLFLVVPSQNWFHAEDMKNSDISLTFLKGHVLVQSPSSRGGRASFCSADGHSLGALVEQKQERRLQLLYSRAEPHPAFDPLGGAASLFSHAPEAFSASMPALREILVTHSTLRRFPGSTHPWTVFLVHERFYPEGLPLHVASSASSASSTSFGGGGGRAPYWADSKSLLRHADDSISQLRAQLLASGADDSRPPLFAESDTPSPPSPTLQRTRSVPTLTTLERGVKASTPTTTTTAATISMARSTTSRPTAALGALRPAPASASAAAPRGGSAMRASTASPYTARAKQVEGLLADTAEVLDMVRKFCHNFAGKPPPWARRAQHVRRFMEGIFELLQRHPRWRRRREEDLSVAADLLERRVVLQLYPLLFDGDEETRLRDVRFTVRLRRIARFLRPEHLDVPSEAVDPPLAEQAVQFLRNLEREMCPRDKMVSVLNACKLAFQMMRVYRKKVAGADDFVPLFIYLVAQANPRGLLANVRFIESYRRSAAFEGTESAYFITNLELAYLFLEALKPESLNGVTEEEMAHFPPDLRAEEERLLALEPQQLTEKDGPRLLEALRVAAEERDLLFAAKRTTAAKKL